MNSDQQPHRILGAAFLFQFVTSFSSGAFIRPLWFLPGNIKDSMIRIAANPWLLRLNILVDLLTAFGIIFLGAILFITLRKQDEKIALVALGIYILEAVLLATSRVEAFSLLRLSQEYAASGQPAALLAMGQTAFESMDFGGSTLHMLAFCCGGVLFYTLLYRSGVVPRVLSLWGLITIFPCLIGTLLILFGYEAPIYLYILYIPFELVIGVWILVKGLMPQQPALPGQWISQKEN